MWPFALPETKVVHLLSLAWATVDISVNQSETSQGNAIIQSGCQTQLYEAYWLRIQSKYVKGMETNRCGIKRISCLSASYPKRIRQKGWKRLDGGIKRIVPN
jgi:hypothetical protein